MSRLSRSITAVVQYACRRSEGRRELTLLLRVSRHATRLRANERLTLSHWSTECLARLPPFCMCLTLVRAAPVKVNIWWGLRQSGTAPTQGSGKSPRTPRMIP